LEQKRWFLLLDGQVSGPYGDQEIENRVDNTTDPLVWGRGQSEWLPPDKWRLALKTLQAQQAVEQEHSRHWKMRVNNKELTPMKMEELIEHLKDYTDLSPVRIWTEGFDDWKEVFQVRKIMDELGISRRSHPRVPIMGNVKGQASFGELHAKLISISEGGIGVNSSKGVQIGEQIPAKVSSPNLFVEINTTLEVVYVGADGYAGMRFLTVTGEAKSAIIEYVKKFQQVAQQR
jgi:hypothetical protein